MKVHEERERPVGEVEAQEGQERRVDAQERREEEREEKKEDANSLHEECHVSNRHDTVAQRMVDPSRQRTTHAQRQRRRVWRAVRRAVEQARDEDRAGEAHCLAEEAEGDGETERQTTQTVQRKYVAPRCCTCRKTQQQLQQQKHQQPQQGGSFNDVLVVDRYSTVSCARFMLVHTDVAVMANREALYDTYHSNVDTERELTMFVPIHLFQFRFADTEQYFLRLPPSPINWWPSWLISLKYFWTGDKHGPGARPRLLVRGQRRVSVVLERQ